jgi:hypothetical protein
MPKLACLGTAKVRITCEISRFRKRGNIIISIPPDEGKEGGQDGKEGGITYARST